MIGLSVLVACGGTDEGEGAQQIEQPEQDFEITDEEIVDPDEIIMELNDVEVNGELYNLAYLQTKIQFFQYGLDISNHDEIQSAALDTLTRQELIRQDAADLGIEVSEETVEDRLEQIKKENKEGYEAYLETFDFSEQYYKMEIADILLQKKYIEEQFPDIDVTEEEIKEAYDEVKNESDEEIPELNEVEESIRQGLTQQKEMEKMEERLEQLEEQADIKTLI